jgi:hypothetical protein
MQNLLTDILIFKTNIREQDIPDIAVAMLLEPRVTRWSVDCGDVDRVLRVEAYQLTAWEVIALVQRTGYRCEELPD